MKQSSRQLAVALERKLQNIIPSHVYRVTHNAHSIMIKVVAGGRVHEFEESKHLGVMGVENLIRKASETYLAGKYEAAP